MRTGTVINCVIEDARRSANGLFRAALVLLFAVAGCQRGTDLAGPARAGSRQKAPTYAYRDGRLENGLRVITLEDFSCPIVSVQLWYHVGSKDDRPDRQGFAHMFEHMMFRGTDRLGPTDHFDLIRRVGGTANGYTNFDVTVYSQILPSNQLRLALWLEAERMALLRIDRKSFDTERKVVEEERRLRLNNPYGTLQEKVQAELYKVHPYRWPIVGNMDHLRAANVAELRRYWRRYYLPNNATLVIAGAVRHERARRLARECFGWIPPGEEPPRVSVHEPLPSAKRSVVIKEKNAPAPVVGVAYRTMPVGHPDAPVLDVIRSILAGGKSSRLYRDLVAESQLAVRVFAMNITGQQDGVFAVAAVLQPFGGKADKAAARLEHHLKRLREEPVAERELLKARNQWCRGLVAQSLYVSSKAGMLGRAAVIEGDVAKVNRRLEAMQRVTAEDVRRVARTHLADRRAVVFRVPRNLLGGLFGGTGRAKQAPVATALAASAPAERPPLTRPKNFPENPPLAGLLKSMPQFAHSRHRLPNGLRVIVVPNREVPFLTMQLNLTGGAWGESKRGAASMAMQMLTRGTAAHSERELAEELDTFAISLWGGAGMDSAAAGASCLSEHAERAAKLLAEVVLTPTFPPEEFGKLRKRVRTELAVLSEAPYYVAAREFRRRLYGDHPYAGSPRGEIADLDALTVEYLKNWWRRFVRPDMGVLIFAGDVDPPRALELAESAFGDWKVEGPAPRVDLPEFPQPAQTCIYLVDRPGSVQSQIRIGQLGITRRNPGYFTSQVVSGYFGGSFAGRLNQTVRVKKGLTYGIWGGYGASRFGGSFSVGTFTKSRSTARAVRAVLAEIRRLAAEPPTAEELAKTQSYHLGSFARRRETPQQVAGALWLIVSHELPEDYFQIMLGQIARTRPADCLRLVRQTLDPDRMIVVVVGEAAKIRKDLEKIAPVHVVKLPKAESRQAQGRRAGSPAP